MRKPSFLRAMRTVRSKRLAQVLEPEDIKPRSKQNQHNLTNPWDEYGVSSFRIRNWKKFRRNQHK